MAWTKLKTAAVIGAAVVLAAGATTAIIIHHRTHSIFFTSVKELTDRDNAQFVQRTGLSPEQAAKSFFDACSRNDWAETEKYWPPGLLKQHPDFASSFTNNYGGLKVVSVGKPFRARLVMAGGQEYPGVYVPYEIRLKNGLTRKWQLAIRCDNLEHQWYWDGGM